MNHNPLVSILIPYKNTARFLPECIHSILAQEYPHWEILAVDDHSTDNSWAVVEAFAKNEDRIRTYKNTGEGIIHALRTAYLHSSGNLITRMDSDDIMVPEKIGSMVHALAAMGHGHLALGKVRYFSDRGISAGYARYERWLNLLTETGSNYTEIYKECCIPSPCWMVYRQDLDACGGFTHNRYPEDYDLAFRFYAQGLQCIPCKDILHLWRDYATRTSRTSEHYAMNYFLELKMYYFLKLHHDPNRPLVVWGAGNKGKTISKILLSKEIAFYWLCDNPNKIGKKIYDTEMRHFSFLRALKKPQSIVSVANEEAQNMIRSYLITLEQQSMKDYFFFC